MAQRAFEMLEAMTGKRASDVHIKVGRPPLYRIDGKLIAETGAPLSEEDVEEVAFTLMTQRQREKFASNNEIDLAFSPGGDVRFRINIFRQKGTIELVIRRIPKDIPRLEDLNLPAVMKKIANEARGLILLTGTVGSGKSTTIASLIQHMNQNFQYHIVTIEDPIEFLHSDRNSSISQRELGIDTETYSIALKYVLRQDPDVIFIGEMRDYETVATAISAAETGHLVLSTLHTIDAIQTMDRLVDFFPAGQQAQVRGQLCSIITAIVSMRLIAKADGFGRVPAVEVMVGTPTVRNLIRENKMSHLKTVIQQGASQSGMQTFDQSLADLYRKGLISLEQAVAEATSPSDLKLSLSGIVSSVDSAREHMR